MPYFHYNDIEELEDQDIEKCQRDYKLKHWDQIKQDYEFSGGLNIPSRYHISQHEKLAKKINVDQDDIEYTFRPAVCQAPGLYQPRPTVNIPHRIWDDKCFIQQRERLNQNVVNYRSNLDHYQRRGVLIHPTAGVGIRFDRIPALQPGQLRTEALLKGRGKGLNHCPGDTPNLPPNPRDRLHNRSRKDSGLYPEYSTTRRGMIATHEINPTDTIGVTPKGPPVAGYAAMQYRKGFYQDTYQEVIDATERMNEALWCDQPSYY